MDLRLTGVSKGIGFAVTRTLLDEGARMVSVSRKPGVLSGPGPLHVAADLMAPDAPALAVERAVQEFGRLDVLVDNAGGPAAVRSPRPVGRRLA